MAAEPRLLALVHSPLTGPSTWRPVERALRALGASALAVDYGGVSGPDWYEAPARRLTRALAPGSPVIVVAHSGAGGLAPSVVEALGARAAGVVFVDAILPHPGNAWVDTASPALVERLRRRAKDGCAPRWDLWFGERALCVLIPDPERRAAFRADLPLTPMAYLEAVAPACDSWQALPLAYVRLSGSYDAEADTAENLGWRVWREPLSHLAVIGQPDLVAQALVRAADGL